MAMHDDITAGVIPRAFRDLFGQLERVRQRSDKENQPQDNDASYEYEVRVQFLEIYGEEIRDLLTPLSSERLTIRDIGLDDEPEVLGAAKHKVESAEEALLCLTRGMMRRVTGATAMNASSSRSHAILSVLVEQTTTLEEPSCGEQAAQHVQVKRSKFNFVDLAGSERQKRTQAEGQRLKEGIDINKGLLVLGNVISALGDPKKAGKFFVPYRDSKLTRLLKGSLGGNHKTLMIACVSPSSSNLEESLNCLRYANRAKNIQNNAIVNVDAGSRLVAELRQQVQTLATDLLRAKEGDQSEGSFTIDILKSLATGSDSSGMVVNGTRSPGTVDVSSSRATRSDGVDLHRAQEVEIELDRTREQLRQAKVELLTTSEALHVTKAEKELYRLQFAATSDETPNMDMDAAFLERAAAYEKEIASLKETVRKVSVATITQEELSPEKRSRPRSRTPPNDGSDVASLESPELARLSSKVLQSIPHSDQLEAEEQAESTEIATITRKYCAEDLDDEQCRTVLGKQEPATQKDELGHDRINGSLRQTQIIEAHMFEISRSIEAKEDLINQLQLSQEKYAVSDWILCSIHIHLLWIANTTFLFVLTCNVGNERILRRQIAPDGRTG
jgi:kinesin family protein 4/21/27